MCSVSVCYLLPVQAAVFALLFCWSAPVSGQRSAVADTCTCSPSPPPKIQLSTLVFVGMEHYGDKNLNCTKQEYSYFVLELDVRLC